MTKKLKYKPRPGYPVNENDAELIGSFLETNFPNGEINPEDLLRLATPKSSPIHDYFEWSDAKAAHEYRLDQARKLIRSIVVEIEGESTPAYHNVYIESANHRRYVTTSRALSTKTLWDQVVSRALTEAKVWKLKYESYKELGRIFEAIDEVERQVTKKKPQPKKEVTYE